ncbi:MAG TPA: hypothetical protein VFA09_12920 [Ktedonobacteraceae bacterium]|nr:hypothetical protein [Ktedonobacteraceae bacterium]
MYLDRLSYELKLMGKRVILTPILVMLGFALIAVFLHARAVDPSRTLSASLEIIIPLAAGIVVATITSQDNAIELQLTMPKKYDRTVLRRFLIIFGWTACIALLSGIIFYTLNLKFIPLSSPSEPVILQLLTQVLTWLAPMLWLISIGICLALLLRSRPASSALIGGIWIFEIIFKDYIAATNWLHPVFLFPTTLIPLVGIIPQAYFNIWLTTRLELIGTALAVLCISWLLLRNPESLLKTASEE